MRISVPSSINSVAAECRNRCGVRWGAIPSRGHIHAILTNPIYAGRIRHKDKVYDGQHPAIIEPEIWEKIQKLENLIAELVRGHLKKPTVATELLSQDSASQLIKAKKLLSAKRQAASWLKLVARIDLQSGSITENLDQAPLSDLLDCKPENLNLDALAILAPFQMRRRGVELKLHLGDAPPEIDGTLVRNIVTARRWLRMIIMGKSLAEIANEESTTPHRIRMVTDLAVLAPDILDAIASGTQPESLNTDKLLKSDISANWVEQREIFAVT